MLQNQRFQGLPRMRNQEMPPEEGMCRLSRWRLLWQRCQGRRMRLQTLPEVAGSRHPTTIVSRQQRFSPGLQYDVELRV